MLTDENVELETMINSYQQEYRELVNVVEATKTEMITVSNKTKRSENLLFN